MLREQYLANVHGVLCLLRCSVEHDGIPRFVADAGYRSMPLGPPFERTTVSIWQPVLPPFPDVRPISRSSTVVGCEVPIWVYHMTDEATLRKTCVCSEVSWKGHRVEPQSWPLAEVAGTRVNGFISNEPLPIRKEVDDTRRRNGDVPSRLLSQMRKEWIDYIARLGAEWSAVDALGDYRAFGPVPIAECQYIERRLPEEWSLRLAK